MKNGRFTSSAFIRSCTAGVAVVTMLVLAIGRSLLSWPTAIVCITATGIVLASLRVRRGNWPVLFRRHFGWFPVTIGIAVYPFALWYARLPPLEKLNDSFFEISAQVLPVLLLASVIDVRRSSTSRATSWRRRCW